MCKKISLPQPRAGRWVEDRGSALEAVWNQALIPQHHFTSVVKGAIVPCPRFRKREGGKAVKAKRALWKTHPGGDRGLCSSFP